MKQPAIQVPDKLDEVLLHACCAPCSSAIVEWLLNHGVHVIIFYFNPNIWPREEYEIRKNESKRHAESLGVQWIDGDYDHNSWCQHMKGLENEPERGSRCKECFLLRLTETAREAQRLGVKYFATTLASSRWKNLEQIECAGLLAEAAVNAAHDSANDVTFWAQNWRKGGLQERRNQLIREQQFYNQQYCGCEFSARNGANTKPLLRIQMREAKRQHQELLTKMSAEIVTRLDSLLYFKTMIQASTTVEERILCTSRILLAFWPLPDEVDIRPLLDKLVNEGWLVLLPKITGEETMELRQYTSKADLKEGPFRILEPLGKPFNDYNQIDFALVPGVAFDAAGHRLGRGKGYYDRFLGAHPHLHKIGVCFPFQRVAEVPSEIHDILMDEVVS